MIDKKDDIIYSAQDIELYLKGKLSPLQMHAMEKAAHDDELLAEAIEGYAGLKSDEWKLQLSDLKNKFENSNSTAKVISLPKRINYWWKAAAAILLIGGTATISYLIFNQKDNVQIAQMVKTTEPTADSISTKPLIEAIASNKETFQSDSKKDEKKNREIVNNTGVAAETENIRADSNFIYKPNVQTAAPVPQKQEAKISEDVAKDNRNTSPASVSNNALNEVVVSNKPANKQEEADEMFLKKSKSLQEKKAQPLNRSFSAQVVGADNTPLPFANISIKKENFGTYADVKGNFRLVSSDSLLTIEVKAAGYEPKFYTLQSGLIQQNKIVLTEEGFAARQNTVIGYGTDKKNQISRRATLLKDSVVNVEPADGWDNYNTYVNNNIEIPEDIIDKNLHGQVQLSFDIKPNGNITNIKVDKSLCDNCDEAAKRLIEQGPQWKVKNGKKSKGKVTVQF